MFLTLSRPSFCVLNPNETFCLCSPPQGSGGNQYVNMLYQLLKLRQACNHPWLVKGLGRAKFTKGGKQAGIVF